MDDGLHPAVGHGLHKRIAVAPLVGQHGFRLMADQQVRVVRDVGVLAGVEGDRHRVAEGVDGRMDLRPEPAPRLGR